MRTKLTIIPASSLLLLASSAAVPLRWTVETSRVQPATFDVVRGETVALEATMQSGGKPFAMDSEPVCIFWQTNGMGSAWWTAPCVATASSPSGPTNILSATFTPEMDPGASSVIGFLGSSGSIYRAAFQLRFRHGPGAHPNDLPLPTPVIDFSRVTVLNPPWSGGGSGGVDTNAVVDIVRKTVDGSARLLPKYLHALDFTDSYPDAAAEYYLSRGDGRTDGGCSAVRDGGFLYRNFDFPFDERAEFVVKMNAGPNRFASVGVAQVGTNLTEQTVTSGKPSRWYKSLPGATVDGINENGVVCEINVVDGEPQWRSGVLTASDVHPLAAVRWALDNGTTAVMVASSLADRIKFPVGWAQNFHWMVADESSTYIVENGAYSNVTGRAVMTNFPIIDRVDGMGRERYNLLVGGESITNAWFTRAYSPSTDWFTDFGNSAAIMEGAKSFWNDGRTKEQHRGGTVYGQSWWQTVHTSIYDITNRTLRVAVQEIDDWYTFAVPSAGGGSGGVDTNALVDIVQPMIGEAIEANAKTGTNQQIVRGATNDDGIVQIDVRGAVTAGRANSSNTADADAFGCLIHENYAPKTELSSKFDKIGGKIGPDDDDSASFSFGNMQGDALNVSESGGALFSTSVKIRGFGGATLSVESYDDAHPASITKDGKEVATEEYVDEHSSPPSPTLRVYDDVQSCWWIGRMVNGVMSWEVE